MNTKAKKTVKTVTNVILWVFLALALLMTVVAFSANASSTGMPTFGKTCFFMVQSNSMKGDDWKEKGFQKGDMIVSKVLTDEEKLNLKVGDVITFATVIYDANSEPHNVLNTHRIVSIEGTASTSTLVVVTQGDANLTPDDEIYAKDIVAKWTGTRVGGIGSFVTFLNGRWGFFCCIILPLAAFFIYEIFEMVKLVNTIRNKGKKVITEADEELIKQRAIEEYLARQAAEKEKSDKE